MTDLWYPITPKHPSPLIQVRAIVTVNGERTSFDANLLVSRGRPPRDNQWAEWIRGKPVPLAPGAVPTMWQPQYPDKWDAPLPAPLVTIQPGRMHSETVRFQAVEEAEAADLAREMERDREMARNGGGHEEANKEQLPWWRDASLIKYEPAGAVTPKMAEGRVMRAVALCGHGQGMTLREVTFGKILADIAAAGEQEAYATSDFVPRLQPLPQDQDDFLTAMSWFVALNPIEMRSKRQQRYATWDFNRAQMTMIWRAFDVPLSFDVIGSRFDISGEGARKAYKSSIARIVRVANGLPAYPHLPVPASHIEALQERNRAARRMGQ